MGFETPKNIGEKRTEEALELAFALSDIVVKAESSMLLGAAIQKMSPNTRITLEAAMAQAKKEDSQS